MRHTGQRQYKCQLCSYTCIQTISLKTHMHNKHPNAEGVVYTCQLCKFRTINKQIYDNHLEDHRNGLIPTTVDVDAVSQGPMTVTIDGVGNGVAIIPEEPVQFQLQVKKTETGELHANKEDIDKLNAIPQLVHSGVDANQLIYSALNIGSHIDGLSYTAQLANGVQSTVLPSLQPAKGLLSSYSITFQAPQILATQPPPSQPVIVDFRSLSDDVEPTVEAASVSSEPSSQGVEEEGVMVLSEVSQGSGMEHVEHALYAQVPQETVSKVSEGTFQASGFEVLQVSGKGSSHEERGEVRMTDNMGALVVSQAGMESVLRNFIVMEGNRVVRTFLDRAAVVEGGEVVGRVMKGQEEMEGGRKGSVGEHTEERRREGERNQVVEGGQVVEKVLVMAEDGVQGNPDTSV